MADDSAADAGEHGHAGHGLPATDRERVLLIRLAPSLPIIGARLLAAWSVFALLIDPSLGIFGGFMQQPMFMQPTYDPGVSAAQAAVAAALRAAQNLRG